MCSLFEMRGCGWSAKADGFGVGMSTTFLHEIATVEPDFFNTLIFSNEKAVLVGQPR